MSIWKYPPRQKFTLRSARPSHWLALALALLGCDDGEKPAREAACARYCDKLDVCDEATDRLGCVQKCTEDAIRSDAYFAARATCVEKSSCNLWWREVDTMGVDECDETKDKCALDDCTKDTLAGTPATEAQLAYCGQVASKLNACDTALSPIEVEARCKMLAPTLSTGYLDAWQQCVALPCEQLPSCTTALGDRFNTDLTFTPIMSVMPATTR